MAVFGLAIVAVPMLGKAGLVGLLERFNPSTSHPHTKEAS